MTEPLTAQYTAQSFLDAYKAQADYDADVNKFRRLIYGMRALAEPGYATSAQGRKARGNFSSGSSSSGGTGMLSRFKLMQKEEQERIRRELERRQIEAMVDWEDDDDFLSWMSGQGKLLEPAKAKELWRNEQKERDRIRKAEIAERQEERNVRTEERTITKLEKADLVAVESFKLVNDFVTDFSTGTYQDRENAKRAIRARVTNNDDIPGPQKPGVIAAAIKRLEEQHGKVGPDDAAKERDRAEAARNAARAAEQKNRDHETKVTKEALESARRGNTEMMARGIYSRVKGGMTKEEAMAEVVQANGIAQYDPTLLAQMLKVGLPPAPTTKRVLNLETGEEEWATNREIADNNRLVPAHSKGETMALRMQAAAWVLMQEKGSRMTPEIMKYYMANGFDNWREEDQDVLEKWFLKYASRDSALENLVRILGGGGEKKPLVIEDISE
jgi:hypothetical protein